MCTTKELHKFHLDTDCCGSHVHRWVDEAITRNVKMLKLHVPNLSGIVLKSSSLISIKPHVRVEDIFNIPDSFYLPNLKFIRIFFKHKSTLIAQKILSSCPALEDLDLQPVDIQSTFVISLPFLKRLSIFTQWYGSDELESRVVIDAPQLQFLNITCMARPPTYVIKNVAPELGAIVNVGESKWEVTDNETRHNVEILTQLSGVKSLTLDTLTLRALSNVDPNMLPTLNNLTLLKLKMGPFYGREVISYLLQASPRLEVFIVDMALEDEEVEGLEWIEPQHKPPCLRSCLRVVELYFKFQEMAKQGLEMTKYLLGNGEVLEKFLVEAENIHEELEFRKEVLTFPRASRDCDVQVL